MSSRRRARRSYIEVPDSDSDDDFLIPDSLNSVPSTGESRLKRSKATSRVAENNPSTNLRGADVKKESSAEQHSPNGAAIIDVDSSFVPKVGEHNQSEGGRGRRIETAQKSRNQSSKHDDDDDFNFDEVVIEEGNESDSDVEIRWRKPKPVESSLKADPVRQSTEKSEISDDVGDGNSTEKISTMNKDVPKYVDDSDGSFNMGGEPSDSDDSSSEFEIELPKKRTPAKKKSPLLSKPVPPKTIGAKSHRSPARSMVNKEKRAVKHDDDSDDSFNMEDDVSEGEDSSEFETDAPKKAMTGKKGTPARQRPAPSKKVASKTAPRRVSALKGIQKPASTGAQKTALKAMQSATGSMGSKRLGARPVLKPKLSKVEKPDGSGRQGLARPSAPLTSSSGPRYRSGLSRKQPISTRLHSYLTPP